MRLVVCVVSYNFVIVQQRVLDPSTVSVSIVCMTGWEINRLRLRSIIIILWKRRRQRARSLVTCVIHYQPKQILIVLKLLHIGYNLNPIYKSAFILFLPAHSSFVKETKNGSERGTEENRKNHSLIFIFLSFKNLNLSVSGNVNIAIAIAMNLFACFAAHFSTYSFC